MSAGGWLLMVTPWGAFAGPGRVRGEPDRSPSARDAIGSPGGATSLDVPHRRPASAEIDVETHYGELDASLRVNASAAGDGEEETCTATI